MALDYAPLLKSLALLTDERIPAEGDFVQSDVMNQLTIPVRFQVAGDKTERVMRKYAADWVRLRDPSLRSEATYEATKGRNLWRDANGKEFPIDGVIVLRWWPKPPDD
jgi:hypothetical protein